MARDDAALRGLTQPWFERSPLLDALREASVVGVPVLLTTDHGVDPLPHPGHGLRQRDATANLRYKFGEDLKAQDAEAAIVWTTPELWPAAEGPAPDCCSLREIASSSIQRSCGSTRPATGAFLHGGVSPEEVILPVALLLPRRARGAQRNHQVAGARTAVPRALLAGALVCSFIASALDGITIVLLVPLLKHLFGTTGPLRTGATPLERWLTDTFAPLLENATPGQAVARMAVVLGVGLLLKNLADYLSSQFNTRHAGGAGREPAPQAVRAPDANSTLASSIAPARGCW